MTPCPSRPARVLAAAVAAGTLVATAACSSDGDGGDADTGSGVAASLVARHTVTASAAAPLTEAGARAALITEGDLEDDWTPVRDAADWRDSLLVGKVDVAGFLTAEADAAADCQRLLDSLYDDGLLGKPFGASALTGFREGDARLLHQVAEYRRADLDKAMAWLASLPQKCDRFTATGAGGERTVQVVEASLPEEGDARQGLTVTVKGTADGSPVTLTLDVAAVRVGADAITVTDGGLDGADHDSTEQAVTEGAQRLKDVQAGHTPADEPSVE
ncbi:hypothetical protein [Streptomyces griseus]|uniref:hypothetical protein n=1 Tax=Streptomyces griseus TaxID=1911 RepID=UPI00055B2E55|nr:hypothetical protein [Streptomyces griseus]